MPKPQDVVLSKKDIGARVRACDWSGGFTQDELAQAIGTHFTAISGRTWSAWCDPSASHQARQRPEGVPDELLHPKRAPKPKVTSRREGHLRRKIERIQELPPAQQQTVLEVLDSLLKIHRQSSGPR